MVESSVDNSSLPVICHAEGDDRTVEDSGYYWIYITLYMIAYMCLAAASAWIVINKYLQRRKAGKKFDLKHHRLRVATCIAFGGLARALTFLDFIAWMPATGCIPEATMRYFKDLLWMGAFQTLVIYWVQVQRKVRSEGDSDSFMKRLFMVFFGIYMVLRLFSALSEVFTAMDGTKIMFLGLANLVYGVIIVVALYYGVRLLKRMSNFRDPRESERKLLNQMTLFMAIQAILVVIFSVFWGVRSVFLSNYKQKSPWLWFGLKIFEKTIEFLMLGALYASIAGAPSANTGSNSRSASRSSAGDRAGARNSTSAQVSHVPPPITRSASGATVNPMYSLTAAKRSSLSHMSRAPSITISSQGHTTNPRPRPIRSASTKSEPGGKPTGRPPGLNTKLLKPNARAQCGKADESDADLWHDSTANPYHHGVNGSTGTSADGKQEQGTAPASKVTPVAEPKSGCTQVAAKPPKKFTIGASSGKRFPPRPPGINRTRSTATSSGSSTSASTSYDNHGLVRNAGSSGGSTSDVRRISVDAGSGGCVQVAVQPEDVARLAQQASAGDTGATAGQVGSDVYPMAEVDYTNAVDDNYMDDDTALEDAGDDELSLDSWDAAEDSDSDYAVAAIDEEMSDEDAVGTVNGNSEDELECYDEAIDEDSAIESDDEAG